MEAPQKELEDENKVSSIEKTTEDRATSVIADEDEIDDSLIVEDDGDFFWILHRIAWGTIKGLLLLGVIIFTVWFVWEEDESPFLGGEETEKKPKKIEKIETDKPQIKKTIEEQTKTKLHTQDAETYTKNIVEKAYFLDQSRINKMSGILSASIIWLKKAKSLGEISTVVLRIEDPVSRAKKIESTLQEADKALEESAYLQKGLSLQIKDLLRRKKQLEGESLKIDNELFLRISRFNSNNINDVVVQKIAKEKEIVEVSEAGKIRETLFKNIQSFDYLLRTKWIPLVRPTEMRGVTPINN